MSSTLLTTSAAVVVNHHHHRRRKLLSILPPKTLTNYNNNKIWLPPPPHLSITSSSSRWRRPVAALDSSDPILHEEEATPKKYYFVVANAKFMLDEEEHFQEQLAERIRLFQERNLHQDFWLLIEPHFLDKFPNITNRLKRPAVALVSTNGSWITFMKLRLDRVLSDCFEADTLEEALASNPVQLEFEKPENWVAPYPKYEAGWWEPFLPAISEKQQV